MYKQYDYNEQKHVHELTGSTKIFNECDDCHNHRFCTVTGEAMYFPGEYSILFIYGLHINLSV